MLAAHAAEAYLKAAASAASHAGARILVESETRGWSSSAAGEEAMSQLEDENDAARATIEALQKQLTGVGGEDSSVD